MNEQIPEQTIPGLLVRVLDTGVLVCGESGTGKSDLALGLLDRGHRLVADDAVTVRRTASGLFGSCPVELADRLEVRGLGIMPLRILPGTRRKTPATEIVLMIHLAMPDKAAWIAWPRLTGAWDSIMVLDTPLPRLTLPISPGRPVPLLVETAVRAFNATPRETGHG